MDLYQYQLQSNFQTAAPAYVFTVNKNYGKLSKAAAADFHTVVAKTLYVTKRVRPDTYA